MSLKVGRPEEKYRLSCDAMGRGLNTLRSPLAEGTIQIRTGWFKTPPRFRLRVGENILFTPGPIPEGMEDDEDKEPQRLMSVQKSISFPPIPEEGHFAILVGRMGRLSGNEDVAFLHGEGPVRELAMAVLDMLRQDLELAEEEYGGFEHLRNRSREYDKLRTEQLRESVPLDPILAGRFGHDLWGIQTATREQVERASKFEEMCSRYYDYVNAFSELERRALKIKNVEYEFSESSALTKPNHAIILPDSLRTVPRVAITLRFYKKDDFYGSSLVYFDPDTVMVDDEGKKAAILLGNQAKILVGPGIER